MDTMGVPIFKPKRKNRKQKNSIMHFAVFRGLLEHFLAPYHIARCLVGLCLLLVPVFAIYCLKTLALSICSIVHRWQAVCVFYHLSTQSWQFTTLWFLCLLCFDWSLGGWKYWPNHLWEKSNRPLGDSFSVLHSWHVGFAWPPHLIFYPNLFNHFCYLSRNHLSHHLNIYDAHSNGCYI